MALNGTEPVDANATPPATPRGCNTAGAVRAVQTIPSGDVITWSPVAEKATATNNPNSADQQTEIQSLSVAEVLAVQTDTAFTPADDGRGSGYAFFDKP